MQISLQFDDFFFWQKILKFQIRADLRFLIKAFHPNLLGHPVHAENPEKIRETLNFFHFDRKYNILILACVINKDAL